MRLLAPDHLSCLRTTTLSEFCTSPKFRAIIAESASFITLVSDVSWSLDCCCNGRCLIFHTYRRRRWMLIGTSKYSNQERSRYSLGWPRYRIDIIQMCVELQYRFDVRWNSLCSVKWNHQQLDSSTQKSRDTNSFDLTSIHRICQKMPCRVD